jgi:hypothetical protein
MFNNIQNNSLKKIIKKLPMENMENLKNEHFLDVQEDLFMEVKSEQDLKDFIKENPIGNIESTILMVYRFLMYFLNSGFYTKHNQKYRLGFGIQEKKMPMSNMEKMLEDIENDNLENFDEDLDEAFIKCFRPYFKICCHGELYIFFDEDGRICFDLAASKIRMNKKKNKFYNVLFFDKEKYYNPKKHDEADMKLLVKLCLMAINGHMMIERFLKKFDIKV